MQVNSAIQAILGEPIVISVDNKEIKGTVGAFFYSNEGKNTVLDVRISAALSYRISVDHTSIDRPLCFTAAGEFIDV